MTDSKGRKRGLLEGRIALVTGGSKGIGKSIAMRMAMDGAQVFISARNPKALADTVKEIKANGGWAKAVPSDAISESSVKKAIGSVKKLSGRLDILVNNAGGAPVIGGFNELSDKDWLMTFELNVMSIVHFVRHALPLLEASSCARIINISSISGVQPGTYNPHYASSKAASINLGKFLSNQLAEKRILVNTVCPGPVHSDSWDQNINKVAKAKGITPAAARDIIEKEESGKVPLGRIGEGEDIAPLVAFLASDEAGWVTGSVFHINGGKLRSIL